MSTQHQLVVSSDDGTIFEADERSGRLTLFCEDVYFPTSLSPPEAVALALSLLVVASYQDPGVVFNATREWVSRRGGPRGYGADTLRDIERALDD